MGKVIINVYKHDDTYFKTPSLLEFEVEMIEGWKKDVESKVISFFTHRDQYFLSYCYKTNPT